MKNQKVLLGLSGVFAFLGGTVIIVGVSALKHFFGYPDIIRADPQTILEKLYATSHIVPYLYYFGVGGAGLCLTLFAASFGKTLNDSGEEVFSSLGKVCGITAGILLYAGIVRYSFLFPRLAELRHSELYQKETIDLIFKAMNTYIGDSIAEHVQFTFTSLMFIFFGLSIRKTQILPKWTAYFGFVTAAIIIIGNLEQFGFKFAFIFNRTGAKLLALWLLCTGIILLFKSLKHKEIISKEINHV